MSLLTQGRRPVSLISRGSVSYNIDEVPELGLEYARSGQLVTSIRATEAAIVDLEGTELRVTQHSPRLSAFDAVGTGEGIPTRVGRLMEWGRTNAFNWSQDLTNAVWTKTGLGTPTTDTVKGPDGLTLAYKMKETTANSLHGISRATPTLTDNKRSPFSFAAKAAERTWILIRTINKAGTTQDSWVNLATGAKGTVNAGHQVWVRYRRGGFYRIAVGFDAASGGTAPSVAVYAATGNGSTAYAGTTDAGLYLTDLQFETDQAFPTAFIRTTGVAAESRAADQFKMTLPIAVPDQFTVFAEISRPTHADLPASYAMPTWPYIWGWGRIGSNRFGCYFNIDARKIVAQVVPQETAGAASAAIQVDIPTTQLIQTVTQFRNVRTAAPEVRLDVGAGFSSWAAANAAITSMAFQDFGIGEIGDGATNPLCGEITACRMFPDVLLTLDQASKER